jgi:hypothetical protein
MKFHVLNISKATKRRRDRFIVVEHVDCFLSGALILKLVPGEKEHVSVESAHNRAQELQKAE